jgi:hypothetical protein
MPGDPKKIRKITIGRKFIKLDPPCLLAQTDVLFPPILLALEKEKPFKKFATLCLFVKTSLINFYRETTSSNLL